MTRQYKVNNELIQILFNNGFIETNFNIKKKDKRTFKLNIRSKKHFFFDYINVHIFNGISGQDNKLSFNENELRVAILFFKLKNNDLKDFIKRGDHGYKIDNSLNYIDFLKQEKNIYLEHNLKNRSLIKIERILNTYNNIKI